MFRVNLARFEVNLARFEVNLARSNTISCKVEHDILPGITGLATTPCEVF